MQKIIRPHNLQIDGNPIYYRTDTDDLEIVSNILVREEVGCVGEEVRDPKLIVDCGAYAGYSALYFLTRYKNARVIALEPDQRNLDLCRLNLEPYSSRVTLINAAIWPEPAQLVLRENEFVGIEREWATMVGLPRKGEPAQIVGIDLATVLANSGFGEIDLLKLNVNGVEDEVFAANATWLPKVRNMVVRLMEKRVEDAFFKAMSGFGFFLARGATGLFACTRIGPKAATSQEHRIDGDTRNAVVNGSFEDYRVEPARIFPGGWELGSNDVANGWHTVVCDPQFRVSLAQRAGYQRSGGNALCMTLDSHLPILPASQPYAAVENVNPIPIQKGEAWRIRAFVKTAQHNALQKTPVRGVYAFLRLRYDDGSYTDLRTHPLFGEATTYAEIGGVVEVPDPPPGARMERATVWLYTWVENGEPNEIPAGEYGGWDVFFDDISCSRV